MMDELTLADFEIRYSRLRAERPDLPVCSVEGCENPCDITMLGVDTTCAYHRLLFDYWSTEIRNPKMSYYMKNQEARRASFARWLKYTGKEKCDRIALEMAREPINWMC